MRIITNKILPPKGFIAINLFGFVFVKPGTVLTDRQINHERIHSAQMKRYFYIFFYLFYILEFFFSWLYFKDAKKAYYNISFEREAYENENNLSYIKEKI